MFKIETEEFGKFSKVKLVNSSTNDYVSIIPEFGANVNEIVLKGKSILDGDENYEDLVTNEWFKGAKLVPFPNRINNGEYEFNGEKHLLKINFPSQGHTIHGLVYNKKFEVLETRELEDRCFVVLGFDFENEWSYPFKAKLKIKYELNETGFECRTEFENFDDKEIPFGDGWHPYFKFDKKVDELQLKFPSENIIGVDDRMIPNGIIDPYDKFCELRKIGDSEFDTGFTVEDNCEVEIFDEESGTKIVVWQDSKYKFLQVFIPPHRNSIAIEPMTCNTNAFNNGDGLIVLKPNERFVGSYGVRVE